MKYVDITPTWEAIMPVLIHLVRCGTNQEGLRNAEAELMRLARMVDALNAKQKDADARAQGPAFVPDDTPPWEC